MEEPAGKAKTAAAVPRLGRLSGPAGAQRGWDSNPRIRGNAQIAGLSGRCLKPLGHPAFGYILQILPSGRYAAIERQ